MSVRLKRLELQGFKSFARPTVFLLDAPITAIIGPNGAGKSNIVDALRWVFGESSFRLLRARQLADLIFAGTERRGRSGMAAVTVVFQNEDGWLPLDFPEVAITRKVYRDGRSLVLLNGQQVRLYVVQDVLRRVGLQDGQYVFIGQGMVDAILHLKPEERRRLLEEAAGIGLHHQRRQEALRRLEATRENLTRLEDVLAELRPQYERLARRAQRMAEAETVQTALQERLKVYYALQWRLRTRALQEARRALEIARRHLDQQRRAWAQAVQAREQAETNLQAAQKALQQVYVALQEAEAAWEAAFQEEQAYQTRWKAHRETYLALEREVQEYESRLRWAEARVQEAREEWKRRLQHLQDAQHRLRQAQEAFATQKRAWEARQAQLRALERRVKALHAERHALQGHIQALQQRLARAEADIQAAAQAVEEAEARVRALEQQLAEHASRLEALRTEYENQAQHVQQAEARYRKAEAVYRECLAQERSAQERLYRLQARWEALERSKRRLEGAAQAIQAIVRVAQEEGVFRSTLAEHLRVPREWEQATAAVLGFFGEVLLVETLTPRVWQAAAQAQGQVCLLNLADLRLHPVPVLPQGPGVIGWLADYIGATEKAQPALEWLGRRVLLVRDAETARRLRPQVPPEILLVTPQGEVFIDTATVLLGHPGVDERLRRMRELESLRQDIATAQSEWAARRHHREEAEKALEATQQAWQTAQTTLAQIAARLHEAEHTWDQAKQTLNQAQTALERYRRDHQIRLQEHARWSQDMAAHKARLEEIAAQIRNAQDELDTLRKRLDPSAFHEAQAEQAYWEKQVRLWEEEVRRAQEHLRRVEAEYQHLQEQLEKRKQELARFQQALQENVETEAHLRQRRETCEAKVSALRKQLPPLEQAVQAHLAEVDRAREQEVQAQNALKEAEARYHEARLRVHQLQGQRASLWRRLQEERLLSGEDVRILFSPLDASSLPIPLPSPLPEISEQDDLTLSQAIKMLEGEIQALQKRLKQLGPVVPELLEEYRRLEHRLRFLEGQIADLRQAEAHLHRLLAELDAEMRKRFDQTFAQVQQAFQAFFERLFGGGKARLVLTDPENWEQTGVDIEVRLPGKRFQRLALLSGGERSLTAIALIFALLSASATPLCVLDEVDAMLDDANVGRFIEVLQDLARTTQFIVITHNPQTIQAAQLLYGITLDEDGTSRVLSLKLEDVPAWLAQETPAAV